LHLTATIFIIGLMARRKELGPKMKKNTSALKRHILWAVIAAIIGGGLAGLAYYLIGLLPAAEPEEGSSLIRQLPGMILLVMVLAVLGILFFGFRAYFMGKKTRHTFQSSRMKIKR
jgi:ABC-type multidrug transport system fused ATPase/permease subunit